MAQNGRVSIAEVMGTRGAEGAKSQRKMSLDDLPELLGDKMPELPRNHVGRHRLIKAMKIRFGDGFRNLPGISDLIGEFDREIEHELNKIRLRNIMGGRK